MITRANTLRRWRAHRRRGTALVEFAMSIPLLATVIGLTFFLGWAMTNQQHVRVSSRYSVWRRARTNGWPGEAELNSAHFADRATDVGLSRRDDGPAETMNDLVGAASQQDGPAGQLAGAVVWDRCSRGAAAMVSATFESDVGLWQQFEGSINSYHVRDGRQWRRIDDLNCHREVTGQFLQSLDSELARMESAASVLSDLIRATYLDQWHAWRP